MLKDHLASVENLIKTIKTLPNNPTDILFFCYTGHGSKDPKNSPWPIIYPPARCPVEGISGHAILQFFEKTQHRLKIILFQACNESVVPIHYIGAVDSKQPVLDVRMQLPGLKELFLHYTGIISATSSAPGEFSYKQTSGYYNGAFFLTGFVDSMIDCCLGKTPTWNEVLNQTAKYTTTRVQLECKRDQHPYWQINIKRGNAPQQEIQNEKVEPEKTTPSRKQHHHKKHHKKTHN